MDFIDLKAQQARIRDAVEGRLRAVLDHGAYIMGPEVTELEQKLAKYTGSPHCVSCSSGTDALLMVLMALGVRRGDAVLVPAFTFMATAEVVSLLGATPVFLDIEPDTYNLDVEGIRPAIARAQAAGLTPRGVIAVDLFGQPADYQAIETAADGLWVLQDAAQSFGATYRGRRAGANCPLGATSFFPAKPLGCYGDGGAIFCESAETAAVLRSIRVHGMGSDKYENVRIGINGRLDTFQAAVLLEKLEIFDDELVKRDEVATRYTEALAGTFVTPTIKPHRTSAWAQYSLRAPNRSEVLDRLKRHGIPSAIYYPKPLHLQKAFADLGYRQGSLPVCEKIAGEIFSIPMHPYLGEDDQGRVIEALTASR